MNDSIKIGEYFIETSVNRPGEYRICQKTWDGKYVTLADVHNCENDMIERIVACLNYFSSPGVVEK